MSGSGVRAALVGVGLVDGASARRLGVVAHVVGSPAPADPRVGCPAVARCARAIWFRGRSGSTQSCPAARSRTGHHPVRGRVGDRAGRAASPTRCCRGLVRRPRCDFNAAPFLGPDSSGGMALGPDGLVGHEPLCGPLGHRGDPGRRPRSRPDRVRAPGQWFGRSPRSKATVWRTDRGEQQTGQHHRTSRPGLGGYGTRGFSAGCGRRFGCRR